MAYCGNCGVNVGSGRFCPNCGTMCIPTAEKPMVRTKSSAAAENKRWKQALLTMFILVVVVLLIMLCFSGSSSKALVGRWEATDSSAYFGYLEFFKDGTYGSDRVNYSGNYSVNGDRLRIDGILMPSVTFTFSVSGDRLKLSTGGQEYDVYHRIK